MILIKNTFIMRGKHTIKNWEDARTAAINMSKYLS